MFDVKNKPKLKEETPVKQYQPVKETEIDRIIQEELNVYNLSNSARKILSKI